MSRVQKHGTAWRHAAETFRRARKLPAGLERNGLRKVAVGLLRLEFRRASNDDHPPAKNPWGTPEGCEPKPHR